MFTEKSEFIKVPSGGIREAFHDNCISLQRQYGEFHGFEISIHSFEGNLSDGRGEFHGTMTSTSTFEEGTIEAYERFTFLVNLERPLLEKKEKYAKKKDWKIFHLSMSKPYE